MTDHLPIVHIPLTELEHIATCGESHRLASVVRAHEHHIELPPILLRVSRGRGERGGYQLLEGNHRLACARLRGSPTIRAVILGQTGLSPAEEERAYRLLVEQHIAAMKRLGQEWPAEDRRRGIPPPPGYSLDREEPVMPWRRER